MNKKVRFGLIGCGRISQKHIEALINLYDKAELICICDAVEENANARMLEYMEGINGNSLPFKATIPRVYIDLDEMLSREIIDVLSICTPSGLHTICGIKAAEKHVNVLTEKPMAVNLESAENLIKACDENKVKLFVVKQCRLKGTVQLLKRAIDKGRFGKIYMVLSNVLWTRPQSYYDESPWRGTWEFDGGAFSNQAIHYIDLVQWIGGPVESVSAITGTLARKIETEDTGCTVIKFNNGAIGNINVTMLSYPSNIEGSITILGERGTAKIGGSSADKIEIWDFKDNDEDDRLVFSSEYDLINTYDSGHTGFYENVLDVLEGNAAPITDGREGIRSLALIEGIYKSSREGRTIHFPLDPYLVHSQKI